MSVGIEGEDGLAHNILEDVEGLGGGKMVKVDGFFVAEEGIGDVGCRDEVTLDGTEELLQVSVVHAFHCGQLLSGIHV